MIFVRLVIRPAIVWMRLVVAVLDPEMNVERSRRVTSDDGIEFTSSVAGLVGSLDRKREHCVGLHELETIPALPNRRVEVEPKAGSSVDAQMIPDVPLLRVDEGENLTKA